MGVLKSSRTDQEGISKQNNFSCLIISLDFAMFAKQGNFQQAYEQLYCF